MKSDKGITLTSLTLYIVLIILVLGFLSLVSQNFFQNTKYISDTGKYVAEFNKFNMYFIEDVKNNADVYTIEDNKIVFEDGTIYTYTDNDIYRNKIKICENIDYCKFSKTNQIDENEFEKKIINVKIRIEGSKDFETENDYVLKYW